MIKKIAFVIVGLYLITPSAICQNFISESKQWNVKNYFWGDIITEIFKIEGDTLINSVNYQKVWQSYDSTLVDWWLMACIREESHTVYILNYNEDERVLYDFNLVTGDTANIANYFCEDMQIVIHDVDTVNYLDVDRKRWALDNEGYEYWLEGIGSTNGILYSNFFHCIFDVWFELLCFSDNDTLLYIKEGEDDCFQFHVGIDEWLDDSQLTIYPSPASTQINIKLPAAIPPENSILTIYNIHGQQITRRQMTERQTMVDVSGMSQGVYFVRVVSDNGVMVGKFVKQ